MYEIELNDLSYTEADDVDSSYVAEDLSLSSLGAWASALTTATVMMGGLALYVLEDEIEKFTACRDAVKQFDETKAYVNEAFSGDNVLSQGDAELIYTKTNDVMSAISALGDYTDLTETGIRDTIFNRVLHYAGQDIAFSEVEQSLLQRLKDIPVN